MAEKMINVLGLYQMTESEYREAIRCNKCGHDTYADPWGERLCLFGNCVELYCKGCGYSTGGWGPMGCKCEAIKHRRAISNRKISTLLRRRDRRRARRLNRLEIYATTTPLDRTG